MPKQTEPLPTKKTYKKLQGFKDEKDAKFQCPPKKHRNSSKRLFEFHPVIQLMNPGGILATRVWCFNEEGSGLIVGIVGFAILSIYLHSTSPPKNGLSSLKTPPKKRWCVYNPTTTPPERAHTWRIITVSKLLVTPICKPFRPFGRGTTPVRGLTNHVY